MLESRNTHKTYTRGRASVHENLHLDEPAVGLVGHAVRQGAGEARQRPGLLPEVLQLLLPGYLVARIGRAQLLVLVVEYRHRGQQHVRQGAGDLGRHSAQGRHSLVDFSDS